MGLCRLRSTPPTPSIRILGKDRSCDIIPTVMGMFPSCVQLRMGLAEEADGRGGGGGGGVGEEEGGEEGGGIRVTPH